MTEPQPHLTGDHAANTHDDDIGFDPVDVAASSLLDGEPHDMVALKDGLDEQAITTRRSRFSELGDLVRAEFAAPDSFEARRSADERDLHQSMVGTEAAQTQTTTGADRAIQAALDAAGFVSAPSSLDQHRRLRKRQFLRTAAVAAALVAGVALAPQLLHSRERSSASSEASGDSAKSAAGSAALVPEGSAIAESSQAGLPASPDPEDSASSAESSNTPIASPDEVVSDTSEPSVLTTMANRTIPTSTALPSGADQTRATQGDPTSTTEYSTAHSGAVMAYGEGPTFAAPLFLRAACIAGLLRGPECG